MEPQINNQQVNLTALSPKRIILPGPTTPKSRILATTAITKMSIAPNLTLPEVLPKPLLKTQTINLTLKAAEPALERATTEPRAKKSP